MLTIEVIEIGQGLDGPNRLTNATSTNLTGVLLGNGTNVGVATATQLRGVLGIPEFATRQLANADLPTGTVYFNTTISKYDVTSA